MIYHKSLFCNGLMNTPRLDAFLMRGGFDLTPF